jgi:Mg-dependent DNase
MARSEKGRALIAEVPRERVLTETDGPFVKVGPSASAATAVPADVQRVLPELAHLWSVDAAEARDIVYRNFSALLEKPR